MGMLVRWVRVMVPYSRTHFKTLLDFFLAPAKIKTNYLIFFGPRHSTRLIMPCRQHANLNI
jgi:hypothetical protein